jgi:hypothetical protein
MLHLEQLREGTLSIDYNPKAGEWVKREWV